MSRQCPCGGNGRRARLKPAFFGALVSTPARDTNARLAESVDATDLKSVGFVHAGSSPAPRTTHHAPVAKRLRHRCYIPTSLVRSEPGVPIRGNRDIGKRCTQPVARSIPDRPNAQSMGCRFSALPMGCERSGHARLAMPMSSTAGPSSPASSPSKSASNIEIQFDVRCRKARRRGSLLGMAAVMPEARESGQPYRAARCASGDTGSTWRTEALTPMRP